MGRLLVLSLLKESIRENLPEILLKSGYEKCHVIIDCAELFVVRPKSLSAETATWPDYKHLNPFKFFIGITPTGFI